MSPFVVTQRRPTDRAFPSDDRPSSVVYREAFATLEEVERRLAGEDFFDIAGLAGMPDDQGRSLVMSMELDATMDELRAATQWPQGFDLPNGDVIEVEATTSERLYSELSDTAACHKVVHAFQGATRGVLLAAWKAEHGIGIGEGR